MLWYTFLLLRAQTTNLSQFFISSTSLKETQYEKKVKGWQNCVFGWKGRKTGCFYILHFHLRLNSIKFSLPIHNPQQEISFDINGISQSMSWHSTGSFLWEANKTKCEKFFYFSDGFPLSKKDVGISAVNPHKSWCKFY